MSFREKTAWACLLSTVAVYLPYFTYVFWLAVWGELTIGLALSAFIGAVVIQVAIQIGFGVGIAIWTKQEPKDERDRAIDNRAVRIAYYVLVTSCFVAIPHIYGLVLIVNPHEIVTVFTVPIFCQLLLFCFVIAEVTRFTVQVIGYRKGV